jgi:hypothetical protein
MAVDPTIIVPEPATSEFASATSIAGMIHSSAASCTVDTEGVAPRSETWRVIVIAFGAETRAWNDLITSAPFTRKNIPSGALIGVALDFHCDAVNWPLTERCPATVDDTDQVAGYTAMLPCIFGGSPVSCHV